MKDAMLKRARECRFFRGALVELAAELPADDEALDALVAEAVLAKENDAFRRIVFAALGVKRRIEARHLAAGACLFETPMELIVAAMHVSGDVARALIEAVVRGGMGNEREATALLLAGIWCKERGNTPFPPELVGQARLLARHVGNNPFAQAPLVVLADLIRDDGLSAVMAAHAVPESPILIKDFIPRIIDPVRKSPLDFVPERPGPIVHSGYTLRRAVPRIGRNDPCPCGSGKKYKKCCVDKDQERLQESSSVPGLTVEELRDQRERFLTKDDLLEMRSYELARLDPLKVADSLKPLLINQLHRFDEVDAVVQLFEKIGVPEDLEDHWFDCVDNASRALRKDLLIRLVKLREGSAFKPGELPFAAHLLLADASNEVALKLIEGQALSALKHPDEELGVELGYALLESHYPALGILVSRGLISTGAYFDAVTLFESLLETRDKLNLPPDDPLQPLIDQRFQESIDAHRDSKALKEAHDRLDSKSQEVGKLKSQLAQLHAELEKREQEKARKEVVPISPQQRPPSAVDEALLSDLRKRVSSLREELTERHSERNRLRRDLKAALDDIEALRHKTATQPEPAKEESEQFEDNLLTPDESFGTQPVRIPEFSRKFLDSLQSLPPAAVRHAMALIGRLAAGDNGAFTGSKRLWANREILRQRVGADHRLLFRLGSSSIELLALVNRKDLERKIKSLTGS